MRHGEIDINLIGEQQPLERNTSYFRAKRLIQIFFAVEIVLIIASIQRFFVGSATLSLILLTVALFLSPIYFLAKKNHAVLGGNLLATTLTITCLFFMWVSEGPRDEVVLALPLILTFSILLGSLRVFVTLLVFIIINLLTLSYLNEVGYITNIVRSNTVNSALLIVILLLLTSFTVWLISKDLLQTLLSLDKENKRVLQSQREIEKLVHYDSLTGLPNRVLAKLRFEYAIKLMQRNNKKICLMFVDLDDFKNINDTLGHQIGDKYLVELAKNMTKTGRQSDVVCRLGGDEFLLILPEVEDHPSAVSVAQKILSCVNQTLNINGDDISSTCSIGLAFAPEHGVTFDELCQKADMAMYQSKRKGKNEFSVFNEELKASHTESLALIADMRQAITLGQLEIYYQPQINIQTNTLVAAEALLRLNHPILGQVSPVTFIPLAESSGQIIDIGEWVINNVVKQIASWRHSLAQDFRVAINISPLQVRRGTLCSFLTRALAESNLTGDCLELEFTESLLIDNPKAVMEELTTIKAAGTSLSIDDFGTGYSSLSYLQNLDIESLKIDRSFVSHMTTNDKNLGIVKAIIQMSKELKLVTVAEGVEDLATLQLLAQLGCDFGQGYFWSKPLPANDFEVYVLDYAKNAKLN